MCKVSLWMSPAGGWPGPDVYLVQLCESVVEGGCQWGRGLYKAFAITSVSPEEQRVEEEERLHSVLSRFHGAFCLPDPAGNMAHHTSDPTRMGVGRSIAVLTSGGDAQGKRGNKMNSHGFDFKKQKREQQRSNLELLPASSFEEASSPLTSRQQSIVFTHWLRRRKRWVQEKRASSNFPKWRRWTGERQLSAALMYVWQ